MYNCMCHHKCTCMTYLYMYIMVEQACTSLVILAFFALTIRFRLCSSRARWSLMPKFCSWVTKIGVFFLQITMRGTLDFTGSDHWAPFNFLRAQLCIYKQFIVLFLWPKFCSYLKTRSLLLILL